jgi:serine O-acetyltransferase
MRMLNKRRLQFWSVICGSDIHPDAQIGGGLVMPHPNGVVMHQDAVIGTNCMVMQQVTIGQLAHGAVPRLGSGVYVGAGAKILGPVVIGDGAAVGANAVVLDHVPAGATAVGVPARVVRRREADR